MVLAIGAWVLSRAQIIIVTRVGERFLRDIRKRAFDHLLGMSLGFFDSEQTGRLVSRMTSDVDTMEDLVQQGLVVFVTNGLIFVFTLTAMAIRSWELTLVCLVVVPGVVVASIWFRRVSNRAYLHVRDTVSQTLSSLQEGLTGRAGRAGLHPRGVGRAPLRRAQPGPARRQPPRHQAGVLLLPGRRGVGRAHHGGGGRRRRAARAPRRASRSAP